VSIDTRTDEQRRLDEVEQRLDALERHLQDLVAVDFKDEEEIATLQTNTAILSTAVGEIDDRTQD